MKAEGDNARADYIAGLRRLADRLEANPDVPLPYHSTTVPSSVYPDDIDQFRAAVKAYGGGEKSINDDGTLTVEGAVGGFNYSIRLLPHLGVCERVEVGTRTLEQQVPAGDVEYVTETVEEPVYEWRCPDSLLRPDGVPA